MQAGDIIAVRGRSWLAKRIRYFMALYLKRKGKSVGRLYNHIAVVIEVNGQLMIAEALGWGVVIHSIEQAGYDRGNHFVILRHKRGFTREQIDAITTRMIVLSGTRYQYENFIQWVLRITLGLNVFRRSNEKAIYCSELGAIAINEAYPNTFSRPNETNPMDFFLNDNFNVIW